MKAQKRNLSTRDCGVSATPKPRCVTPQSSRILQYETFFWCPSPDHTLPSYHPPSRMSAECFISPNPDIAGIGIRAAIYVQNFLSFAPAFYALLNDKKVDMEELQSVEKQSTTILLTAFAILISLIVQAQTFGLSSFHISIVLSLSWMNNTNTFIYFLLYIHHKSYPADGDDDIAPKWREWIDHLRQAVHPRPKTAYGDIETDDRRRMYTI
jgi:hypothetical protein